MDYSKAITEFVAKTKDFTKTVSKKAVDIKDQAKINIDIASLQSKLNEDYQNLGKIYYESIENKEELPEEYKEIFNQIDDKIKQIGNLTTDLNELKKCVVCDECNFANKKDAVFCSKCGKKLN